MFNFQNPLFSKLYRYYCAKLLKRIGSSVFYFLYASLLTVINGRTIQELCQERNSGQEKLTLFWLVSLFQLYFVFIAISPLISYLVGRSSGGENWKKGQYFSMPGISKEEDVKVLLLTPGVERKTVIWAKFAAAFTYFSVINFLVCLLFAIYFLTATNLGAIAVFSFLLLNSLFFGLANFCFVVPFLFYQQEGGSWLTYLLVLLFIILLILVLYFSWNLIAQYPLVFCLLSTPLLVLTGGFFFGLYRKKFLTQDLG